MLSMIEKHEFVVWLVEYLHETGMHDKSMFGW